MKVLIIGSDAREHALAWSASQSPRVTKLYASPGNPGISAFAETVQIGSGGNVELADWAERNQIDLTIVGPEAPLTTGIVDEFQRRGLKIFGPNQAAAQIEASKLFAKELMAKYEIPTARYRSFSKYEDALHYLQEHPFPVVIKADGLAAGKGVTVATTLAEAEEALRGMMLERVFGDAGDLVVVEEFLEGEEASILAVTDGTTVLPLEAAQDHKRVFDGDEGPNTGGMGAYSPAPVVTPEMARRIQVEVLEPTIKAMAAEGRPYQGVLYAGLMITSDGPKVVEFNCRMGDPETQVVLPRLRTDWVELCEAAIEGRLDTIKLEWDHRAAVCVVLASEGYPGRYATGCPIEGTNKAEAMGDAWVFHAGTSLREAPNSEHAELVTAGGRVLAVTALGTDIRHAVDRCYEAVRHIRFPGMHYRKDIAHRALSSTV